MKKLYIIASPRWERSKSIVLWDYVNSMIPWDTEILDLFKVEVPYLTNPLISYMFGYLAYDELNASDKIIADLQQQYIDMILRNEMIIIAVPTWNFGMPWILKSWFDLVIRYNVTYTIDNWIAKGLISNIQKAIVVGARWFVYTWTDYGKSDDLTWGIAHLLQYMWIDKIDIYWLEWVNTYAPDRIDKDIEYLKTQIDKNIVEYQ